MDSRPADILVDRDSRKSAAAVQAEAASRAAPVVDNRSAEAVGYSPAASADILADKADIPVDTEDKQLVE